MNKRLLRNPGGVPITTLSPITGQSHNVWTLYGPVLLVPACFEAPPIGEVREHKAETDTQSSLRLNPSLRPLATLEGFQCVYLGIQLVLILA